MINKPCLYVLVGVPASGKTSWVADQSWSAECTYISTDKYVEEYAESQGKTYSEIFEEYMPTAVSRMAQDVREARQVKADIIWDQTSTTIASRVKKFRMLPEYYKIAVVFSTPEEQEWKRRLDSRPGKVIPSFVLQHMVDSWQEPTVQEGFDEVWHV